MNFTYVFNESLEDTQYFIPTFSKEKLESNLEINSNKFIPIEPYAFTLEPETYTHIVKSSHHLALILIELKDIFDITLNETCKNNIIFPQIDLSKQIQPFATIKVNSNYKSLDLKISIKRHNPENYYNNVNEINELNEINEINELNNIPYIELELSPKIIINLPYCFNCCYNNNNKIYNEYKNNKKTFNLSKSGEFNKELAIIVKKIEFEIIHIYNSLY
jgi:hypothetical protein